MSEKNKEAHSSPMLVALGSTLVAGAVVSTTVNADANPFGMTELPAGYQVAMEGKCGEGKCGEGKCGGDKETEGKCGEGKCGEGKCGGAKNTEGTCGSAKESEGKCGEGKCGEGKCGGNN